MSAIRGNVQAAFAVFRTENISGC